MRSISNAIYTGVAWTPMLAIGTACCVYGVSALAYVEAFFQGTTFVLQ